jgi:hypothetical protein
VSFYEVLRLIHNRSSEKYRDASLFYGFSFLFFAMMNSSALFYHCFAPPPLYIEDIGLPVPYNATITHISHVVDICSTACSCLSFIIGRLYHIHAIERTTPSLFFLSFLVIYCLGYFGLAETEPGADFATVVPFLGEFLYPGILGATATCAPLLNWPRHKHALLLAAFCAVGLAFGMGLCEVYLCKFAGSNFTAPLWAFFLCDVAFLIVADLVDIR